MFQAKSLTCPVFNRYLMVQRLKKMNIESAKALWRKRPTPAVLAPVAAGRILNKVFCQFINWLSASTPQHKLTDFIHAKAWFDVSRLGVIRRSSFKVQG